jgi:hypothetical protein
MAVNNQQIGTFYPANAQGEYNKISFAIQQALAKMQTSMPVEVMACTNSGGLSIAGTVDVRPLVNMIDGQTPPNATPHGIIYNIPYSRMQGGINAVIMDPKVGDIGIALFASRDISKVVATKAQANPGSHRQYDWGDAMYIGAMLNGVPTQFIQFTDAGIVITSPTAITLNAPTITLNGTVIASGDVTAEGTSVHTHIHSGVSTGSENSGEPV